MKDVKKYGEQIEYLENIKGWVCSVCNRYFGEQKDAAKYCCAKIFKCEDCGKEYERRCYTTCPECHEKRNVERYNKMPKKVWNGEGMIYSDSHDKFFNDFEEIHDHISYLEFSVKPEKITISLEDLRLIICEKTKPRDFSLMDFCSDEFQEDTDIHCFSGDPEAFENDINEWLQKNTPTSYLPGKFAVDFTEAQ